VRKATAILLILVYSFSAIQLSELLKVSALVAHYYETRQNDDHNIGFLDFLVMHYITDDGNAKDNDRDTDLPFKSNHNIIASTSSTFILERTETLITPPLITGNKELFHYNTPFISSNFYKIVWNPPRLSRSPHFIFRIPVAGPITVV
jgi:hypothetical protein